MILKLHKRTDVLNKVGKINFDLYLKVINFYSSKKLGTVRSYKGSEDKFILPGSDGWLFDICFIYNLIYTNKYNIDLSLCDKRIIESCVIYELDEELKRGSNSWSKVRIFPTTEKNRKFCTWCSYSLSAYDCDKTNYFIDSDNDAVFFLSGGKIFKLDLSIVCPDYNKKSVYVYRLEDCINFYKVSITDSFGLRYICVSLSFMLISCYNSSNFVYDVYELETVNDAFIKRRILLNM